MKTRAGNTYPLVGASVPTRRKRVNRSNFFDRLPDEIVLSIFSVLASSADSPGDFVATLSTCKRFNGLGLNPLVLSQASAETFAVKARKWTPGAKRFLQRCADAGNVEACYTLGMIEFYVFQNRRTGAALMAKAAMRSHALALYSLAIVKFNGSGGTKNIEDVMEGFTLCARAASLGHIDALRELGHCFKEGYGIAKNEAEGQRILLEANMRELVMSGHWLIPGLLLNLLLVPPNMTVFGYGLPPPKAHPANHFLTDWYGAQRSDPMYRNCSYSGCGRQETRMHEFRRCSVCSVRFYCSWGCQARDWTMGHSMDCRPTMRFPMINANGIY